jgi:hypothetical protein
MTEVIKEQIMLDLINGAGGLKGDVLEADPNEKGTGDVVAHDAFEMALAMAQAS